MLSTTNLDIEIIKDIQYLLSDIDTIDEYIKKSDDKDQDKLSLLRNQKLKSLTNLISALG